MAYKRYYGKRKIGYRKRYRKGRQTGWVGMAKKALKTASYVAKLVNAEYKYADQSQGAAASTNGGTIGELCQTIQGTGANANRTGDSIKLKNLTIRMQMKQNGSVQESIRVIIFIDKQNTIAGFSTLLASVGTANAIYSPKLENNKFDTKILYDKTFVITTNNPIKEVEKVIKLGWHQTYNTGTNTVNNNCLKIGFISQQATAGTTFAYYAHTTYLDN